MTPSDLQQEMKKNYVALAELLRHFWFCFPIKTPQLEEKVYVSAYWVNLLHDFMFRLS